MIIDAAVAHGNRQPLVLETAELDEPQAGEILVRIVATGICHTDLTVLDHAPLPWPAVLGHEGAGIVERVGANVTRLRPGDHVVMTSASCGNCSNCLHGQSSFCLNFRMLNMSGGRRTDGSCILHQHGRPAFGGFLGQSSFAARVLVTERNAVDRARLAQLFAAQRGHRTALKRSTAPDRIRRLQRLRTEIADRTDAIDEALHLDLRKPRMGSRNVEVHSVFAEIDTAIAELELWMQPETVEPSPRFAGNRAYVQYEPRGVVLLLGPWNFPFSLVFAPLVPIVAAGNACIVKPNEMQPATSALVAEIVATVFPENEVACVEGGVRLAEALQELPFDHIFFTGSPAVGKRIMAAAAKHLSSVTLELGGKCPAILDDAYPIADAAAKIVGARFTNAGQLCLSVDYVWVPRTREQELLAALGAAITGMFYVDGTLQTSRLSRLVDARNLARVKAYIDEAVAHGARLAFGGEIDEADLTIHPTIVVNPPLDTRIMQEEIFGPVLPVIGYDSIDAAVDQIDATGKPLALYVFSHDQAFVDDVLDRTSSGGVTVNHVLMHYAENRLPFGGVNGSGMGRYKGIHGFRELSNARSVFVQAS
ncbi:MAG: aldehyde dehydrogenase family protein [Janthinobacterium lividum]